MLSALVAGIPGGALAATPGAQLWATRYDGPSNGIDSAGSIAVAPDGTRVYVTGVSFSSSSSYDFATVAYDASTGSELWSTRYNGPGNLVDEARALAVNPDGSTVFVTGESMGSSGWDYATVAYDTATGSQLWLRQYKGHLNTDDYPYGLSVGPDGSRVFVTGTSWGTTRSNGATIAYDASTGAKLWVRRSRGAGNHSASEAAVAVNPQGSTVFVTGASHGPSGQYNYSTIAYDAATGTRLWAAGYDGPANADDFADSLGLSPDGSTAFVTGWSKGIASHTDYATIAYDSSSGTELWVKRYDGPSNGHDLPFSLSVSPNGTAVFITGSSSGSTSLNDYATLGYDSSTGAKLWLRRYDDGASGNDQAYAMTTSPDGSEVFVTGGGDTLSHGFDDTTIAYTASTGAKGWLSHYARPGKSNDNAYAIAVSPDGSRVFITGDSRNSTGIDYATVAYQAA